MGKNLELVKQQYSYEISEIYNRLNALEQGLITENYPNASMYGSLSFNIVKLRKDISVLVSKIVNESDSVNDELFEAFSKASEEEKNS